MNNHLNMQNNNLQELRKYCNLIRFSYYNFMNLKRIIITLVSTVLINGFGNFFSRENNQCAESAWAYAASDLFTTAVTGGMSSAPCGTFSGVPTAHSFEARHIRIFSCIHYWTIV
jgi:hypothetical protein